MGMGGEEGDLRDRLVFPGVSRDHLLAVRIG